MHRHPHASSTTDNHLHKALFIQNSACTIYMVMQGCSSPVARLSRAQHTDSNTNGSLVLLDSAQTFSLTKILGPWSSKVHHNEIKVFQHFFEDNAICDEYQLNYIASVRCACVCQTLAGSLKRDLLNSQKARLFFFS